MNLINIMNLSNNTLFDDIVLPSGYDKDLVINSIFDECALFPPLYPEPELFHAKIQVFFQKWYTNFEKIMIGQNDEYTPTENLIREDVTQEDYTRDRTNDITRNYNDDETTINQTSAYDTSEFQNRNKEQLMRDNTDTDNTSEKITDGRNISVKSHGSIGVITPQDMLEKEWKLRTYYNPYKFVACKFFEELMLHVTFAF